MDLIIHRPRTANPDRIEVTNLGTNGMRRMVCLSHPIEYHDKSYIAICGPTFRDASNVGIIVGHTDQHVFIPFGNIGTLYECNKVIKDPNVLVLDTKTYAGDHAI